MAVLASQEVASKAIQLLGLIRGTRIQGFLALGFSGLGF